ncbi:MAG: ATP-binding cassette domain-containing protein, partial [Bacillota bacterium]
GQEIGIVGATGSGKSTLLELLAGILTAPSGGVQTCSRSSRVGTGVGSHAAGTAGKDSDVDLLIIQAEPFNSGDDRRREMVWLRRVRLEWNT